MNKVLSFPDLLKSLRKESWLNQEKFAEKLWVSSVLIAMVETGQKEPSKKFITKLAEVLWVRTFSLLPFLTMEEVDDFDTLSSFEKKIYQIGNNLQQELINKKAKLLTI